MGHSMRRLFLELLVAAVIAVWCVWHFKPLAVDRTAADSLAAVTKAMKEKEALRESFGITDTTRVRREPIHYPPTVIGRTFDSRTRAAAEPGKSLRSRPAARHLTFEDAGTVRLDGVDGTRTFRCVWRDPGNVVFVGGDTVFDAQYDSTSGVLSWRGELYDIRLK